MPRKRPELNVREKAILRYIEKQIDRKFILKQIGLNSNSSKMAHTISKDIEESLVVVYE